jgi:hypothetical protein
MKKTRLKHIDFFYFPIGVIMIYVPFHLLEEAYFNFPLWMFEHYNIPQKLSYPHWLINNLFFLITLLIGCAIFLKNKRKYTYLGFGILIWGFMNSMEHIVFSIIDNKLSPGIYSSILFLIVFIWGIKKLYQIKLLNKNLITKSILAAISYWIIPITIIVSIGNYLVAIFP